MKLLILVDFGNGKFWKWFGNGVIVFVLRFSWRWRVSRMFQTLVAGQHDYFSGFLAHWISDSHTIFWQQPMFGEWLPEAYVVRRGRQAATIESRWVTIGHN